IAPPVHAATTGGGWEQLTSVPRLTIAQFSPTSPPTLFWSPSCTMNSTRYTWPICIIPAAMRSATFQRASAPKPSSVVPGGTGSPASRFQLFLAGSGSGVIVTTGGLTVLSTRRTAAFQVPNTALGGSGVPPNCQSPARLSELVVISVMNNAG